MQGITKRFGQVVANDNVSLDIRRGEILALLGENGSGKTTLMNMLSGIYSPDEGQIFIDGSEVSIRSPKEAFDLGVGMIHQHFKLVDVLTCAENIILGLKGSSRLNMEAVSTRVREICGAYGFDLDPNQKIYDMSVSQKQTVEIVKVLYRGADILILDEPTAVLTPQETDRLFTILRNMKADGKAIIIITHKLHEVLDVSDRVAVLRKGRFIGCVDTSKTTQQELVNMMVGHATTLDIFRADPVDLHPRITVKGLTCVDKEGVKRLDNVSFVANSGEILGIAGISGNGQSRLLGVCMGELKQTKGSVKLFGEVVDDLDPAERRAKGLRYVPEQRLGHGSVPEFSLINNTLLTGDDFHSHGFIKQEEAETFTDLVIERFHVKPEAPKAAARSFSGGNLQKFIVGREILSSPGVLIIDQPTWGVDVGAATVIHNSLMRLRSEGAGILVVSEEINELFAICDRIAVMYRGCISPAIPVSSITTEELGRWMAGLWVGSPFRHAQSADKEAE